MKSLLNHYTVLCLYHAQYNVIYTTWYFFHVSRSTRYMIFFEKMLRYKSRMQVHQMILISVYSSWYMRKYHTRLRLVRYFLIYHELYTVISIIWQTYILLLYCTVKNNLCIKIFKKIMYHVLRDTWKKYHVVDITLYWTWYNHQYGII